ncbi:DUF4382 domain-containing protein [Vibrio sp.]|uniref:DUF4382 domain-containing protein n=1 Tax=Vibrio sp. TaxID=678 RepID=UPI003D0DFA0D
MKYLYPTLAASLIATALTGCFDSSSNDQPKTTPVTLSVTDAPVDEMEKVVVAYSKVAFLPLDGSKPILFDVYQKDEQGNYVDDNGAPLAEGEQPLAMRVDLLQYQGQLVKPLVEQQEIPVGDYKLCVFAHDGNHPDRASYVQDSVNQSQYPLTVKGDGKCPQGVGELPDAGVLYFNKTFTVNAQNNDFVLDFDLRRGLKEDTTVPDSYSIQRTSVSLINSVTTAELTGSVDPATFNDCELNTPSNNGFAHAVYLYPGDVAMADMGTFAGTGSVAPIAAANVQEISGDEGSSYQFGFGHLAAGSYTLGYTCSANDDSEEGIVEGETFAINQASDAIALAAGDAKSYSF